MVKLYMVISPIILNHKISFCRHGYNINVERNNKTDQNVGNVADILLVTISLPGLLLQKILAVKL